MARGCFIDLIAVCTQLVFSLLPPVIPHVKSGGLTALAVTSANALPDIADVPAVAETVRGYEAIA